MHGRVRGRFMIEARTLRFKRNVDAWIMGGRTGVSGRPRACRDSTHGNTTATSGVTAGATRASATASRNAGGAGK